MASPLSLLLFSSLLLTVLSTATARPGLPFHPCKTLLVSTYSVSFGFKSNTDNNNLAGTLPNHPHPGRPDFFAVVAEVRELDPKPHRFFLHRPQFFPDHPEFNPHPHLHHIYHHRFPQPEGLIRDETLVKHPDVDFPFLGSSSSFRDRAIDVLNVLASLLFGAACGALTAGTMYLIWSLFTCRFDGCHRSLDVFSDDDDNDNDDDEEDIFNPKKPHNNTNTDTNNDDVKGALAVPAPPSLNDSTDTALLKKETA